MRVKKSEEGKGKSQEKNVNNKKILCGRVEMDKDL